MSNWSEEQISDFINISTQKLGELTAVISDRYLKGGSYNREFFEGYLLSRTLLALQNPYSELSTQDKFLLIQNAKNEINLNDYVVVDINQDVFNFFTSSALLNSDTEPTGGGAWGEILGNLSDQLDLQNALNAKQDNLSVAPNTGLDLSVSDELSTTYNSTIADNVQSVAVGGISAGTPASQLKSLNMVQVLDTLIFPTVLASIGTNKSVSLSVSGGGGTLEIGATISRQLTANFVRGTIINGDGTTNSNPLVGAATQYTFSGTGISPSSQASNVLNIGPSVVVSGSNNWSVIVNHDAGTGDYFDNKGNPASNLDASRVSGTVSDNSSSPSITGVHPYFYLKSASPITASSMATAIANGTATKVVASSTGTLNIPYNVSSQYLAVAYPSTSTTKTVYYVTALDNGAITVVFNAVATESVNSPDGYWSGVNYKIHTSKSALTNSNPTIQLRNS